MLDGVLPGPDAASRVSYKAVAPPAARQKSAGRAASRSRRLLHFGSPPAVGRRPWLVVGRPARRKASPVDRNPSGGHPDRWPLFRHRGHRRRVGVRQMARRGHAYPIRRNPAFGGYPAWGKSARRRSDRAVLNFDLRVDSLINSLEAAQLLGAVVGGGHPQHRRWRCPAEGR